MRRHSTVRNVYLKRVRFCASLERKEQPSTGDDGVGTSSEHYNELRTFPWMVTLRVGLPIPAAGSPGPSQTP